MTAPIFLRSSGYSRTAIRFLQRNSLILFAFARRDGFDFLLSSMIDLFRHLSYQSFFSISSSTLYMECDGLAPLWYWATCRPGSPLNAIPHRLRQVSAYLKR